MSAIPLLLLSALITVESSGNDKALGDFRDGEPTAFGCLQITDAVLVDVNRVTGLRYTRANCFNREMACHIALVYLSHYATTERLDRDPTGEDYARIWNGGPNGWRKPETLIYWLHVQRELDRMGTWDAAYLNFTPTRLRVGRKLSTEPRERAPAQSSTKRPNTTKLSGWRKLSCAT